MRARVVLSLWLALGAGCRVHATASVPPDGVSRIVVHSTIDPPAGISIREGVGIVGPSLSAAAGVRGKTQTLARFPAELTCPSNTACLVVVRKRVLAVVFAFDPVVEIDIPPTLHGRLPVALASYRDQRTTSAALGALLRDSSALHDACKAGDTHRVGKLRRKLMTRARRETRPVVRDATRLALVTEHCGTAPDLELARAVLDIEPTSPAISLWTHGLVRARAQLGRPASADAAIDEVIAKYPDPDVGALLLERLAYEAEKIGDAERERRMDERLAEPRFAGTMTARVRRFYVGLRAPLRVHPGDALPDVSFPALDGSTWLATADMRGAPQLVYFGASWCGGCIASLPKLHRFVADHPGVRVLYVLWDSAEDAATFVRERGPLPGTVVRADERARAAIQSAFFDLVALPSFVLADGDGRVVATSVDHELGDLAGVLPDPGAESP